jgi:hypothetical protein
VLGLCTVTLLKSETNDITVSKQNNPKQSVSPKDHFVRLLSLIGKSFCTFEALTTAYFSEPTMLQLYSFGSSLNDIICQNRDANDLEDYLSCGVSLNPTNEYGDSLVHQLCRKGDEVLVYTVLKCYTKVLNKETPETRCNTVNPFQISNYMGRTPLHETCCSPKTRFRIVDIILHCDPFLLFVTDQHGYTPLEYISVDQWPKWIVYLNAKFDACFKKKSSMEPPLVQQAPNTRSIPVSNASLSPEMANLVATGQMTPKDARKFLLYKSKPWNDPKNTDDVRDFDYTTTQVSENGGQIEAQESVCYTPYKDISVKNRMTQSFCDSASLLIDEYDSYAYYIRHRPKNMSSNSSKS